MRPRKTAVSGKAKRVGRAFKQKRKQKSGQSRGRKVNVEHRKVTAKKGELEQINGKKKIESYEVKDRKDAKPKEEASESGYGVFAFGKSLYDRAVKVVSPVIGGAAKVVSPVVGGAVEAASKIDVKKELLKTGMDFANFWFAQVDMSDEQREVAAESLQEYR